MTRRLKYQNISPSKTISTHKELSSKSLVPSDPLSSYLAEINKYPTLDKKEELRIAKEYKESGDIRLAEILVTSNLRFVVKIAAEYSKFGTQMIDLIQEGNIGLMKAVKEFNPYKNVRLITYASWWIRGYIQEYTMKHYSQVKIGTTQNQRKLFYQLQKQKNTEETSPLLLSHRLGASKKEIESMNQRLSQKDISLDSLKDKGSELFLSESLFSHQENPDEKLIHQENIKKLKHQISKLRSHLNEKEIFILDHRLLTDSPLTLQEIGKQHGTTREAVRQIEVRLINKIKKEMPT